VNDRPLGVCAASVSEVVARAVMLGDRRAPAGGRALQV